jgi:hypothetical protein
MVIEHSPRVPVVMVTAGGYGPEAWRYTARTLVWLLSGRDEPVHGLAERSLQRFRRIKESLSPTELFGDPFQITEADLLGDLEEGLGEHRVLDHYTPYGIELAFERYGLLAHLEKEGYPDVEVECSRATGFGDRVRVYTADEEHLVLMELVVKVERDIEPYRLLDIEWLLLQNPRAQPTPERPLLPGQDHPGLGCLELVVGMLVMACERLELDGLLFAPSHYHVAAQASGMLRFLEPADQAFFVALGEVTKPLPLHEATKLVADGRICDAETGEPVAWRAKRMFFPVSARMKEAFASPEYEEAVREATRNVRLVRRDVSALAGVDG